MQDSYRADEHSSSIQNDRARSSVATTGLNSVCKPSYVRTPFRIIRITLIGTLGFLYLTRAI
eukprot:5943668-Pyramimonas_sp.AAC.1